MTTIQTKCFNCDVVCVVGESPQELPVCHTVLTYCSRDFLWIADSQQQACIHQPFLEI